MPIVHYLNVGNGDCSIIEHISNNITVIDVNLAKIESIEEKVAKIVEKTLHDRFESEYSSTTKANYHQKDHPENPISYLQSRGIKSIFRFILTHPDKDHMGGLKALADSFSIINFWDILNNKLGDETQPDWKYYQETRLKMHASLRYYLAGTKKQYFNLSHGGEEGGDGLWILSPTPELIEAAMESGDYNDASYVLLYRTLGRRILFSGDAHDETWLSVLDNYGDLIVDVDVLIAPHHGRHSERDYSFLEIVNPKLTFFGNASSEHLAYEAWYSRDLEIITNNEGGNLILDIREDGLYVQVTNEKFAKNYNPDTIWDEELKSWVIKKL